MQKELKKFLILLIVVLWFGGLSGLFNILYVTLFLAFITVCIAIKLFWTDILIVIGKFISSFIIPKRW
ncbi:conserved hypothetical protein [Methanolacinia petrolearia DSM 11571]|uniref:Uncharacterized protein n=1 Tax=Methanolacinia petrolearia (strain DSM 11571 / OCM 486 / SEBR 4847) TaxID=679926 RepID=E1RKI5_METP4|nr:conserved hypothetical protein [Methanolacinia petrolearia DSM 11571]